ncbi:MAG: pyridoxal-phosphate dependent enzyme [Chloroflexota bacterium]
MTTETTADLDFRPATEADMPFIQQQIERHNLDGETVAAEQFITLRRDGEILAFGRVKPYEHTFELGSVVTVESERGRGLGEAITRELIRRFPQDEVFITTDIPTYYERMGFLRTKILPDELAAKVERVERAGFKKNVTGMVYDRNYEKLPTIADVFRAKHLLEGQLEPTPLVYNPTMSRELGFEAYLKLENLQPIGAFKVRGGINLCASLSDDERARGIVGASTGNHGQSLAYGAKQCHTRCVIAMPKEANPLKVESMRALGADVQFHGANFEEARDWAEVFARENGMRYVHHVNSPELIAGVSTMSLEIMDSLPEVDVIITPIGGGSASVGHCLVAKALKPSVQVIGVQTAGAPAVYNSWRERTLQTAAIHTAAEGLATGHPYYTPVRVFIEKMDDILLVSEQELRDGILRLARTAHVVAEESGAAATAAAVQIAERLRGKKVAIIVSGGNIPLDHLRRVLLDANL